MYFYSPLDGMLVHRRVTPSIKFAGIHLHTWVERGTVGVKCLAQEHNTMSPARARTRTTRSAVERTNHEATAPPTMYIHLYIHLYMYCIYLPALPLLHQLWSDCQLVWSLCGSHENWVLWSWYRLPVGKKLSVAFVYFDSFVIVSVLINNALEMQRQAKINDKNQRFGVFMAPMSRRSKITQFAARCNNKLAYSVWS